MKLNNITLRLYRHAEFCQFISDVHDIVAPNVTGHLQLEPLVAQLDLQAQLLGRNLHQNKKKPLTAELQALDKRRDNAIQGIALIVKAYSYHHQPNVVAAAALVQNKLKLYRGNIAYQNYMAESACIHNFLTDSAQPKLAAAIALLPLAPWVAELQAAHTAFEDCFMQRIQAIGAQQKTDVAKLRKQTTTLYRQVANLISAQYIISDGAAPYDGLIADINALIKQYKQVLRSRKSEKAEA